MVCSVLWIQHAIESALISNARLAIAPGGIAEMFRFDPNNAKEMVLLRERAGFIRLALKTGTPLVPVFAFGNSRFLKLAPGSRLLERVSRALQVSLIFFYGRWGLPVPFQKPLLYAVGKPMHVPYIPDPSPETVQALQEKFIAAVIDLFERYKHAYGWQHKSIRVL